MCHNSATDHLPNSICPLLESTLYSVSLRWLSFSLIISVSLYLCIHLPQTHAHTVALLVTVLALSVSQVGYDLITRNYFAKKKNIFNSSFILFLLKVLPSILPF